MPPFREGQKWGPFVVRRGRVRGTWRRRLWALLFVAVFVATLVTIGALVDLLWVALGVGLLSLLWWGLSTVRLLRGFPIPTPPPRGPLPEDGGVREPRRPKPRSPAGAAALPIPDEDATSGPGPHR